MFIRKRHVDDSQLQLLVYGDDDSADYQATAAHVETCEECQRRLTRLASSDEEAREVCELLSAYPQANLNGIAHWDNAPPRVSSENERGEDLHHRKSIDFLAPPSHPEMLGRLGRYEIERVIGSGGMGIVFKAFDTELNRPVAVKVLGRHLAHSGAARQRFAREARAAAAVVHEHVVSIHNVETDGDVPFLVMQYVTGESLQSRIDRDGPLCAKEALRIAIQAAAGLAAAHEQGVIHRDVKPANILLENNVERALLTDFGLARTVDDASLTHTGIVIGTPHYMAPEQANGETSDHRSDLFSLGSVLYFMLTGRPPFRAERAMGVLHRICHDRHRPAREVNPDVPEVLSKLIDRMLEKTPAHRMASAAAVRESLSEILAALQQTKSRRVKAVPRLARNWLLMGVAALIVIAVVVADRVQHSAINRMHPEEDIISGKKHEPTAAARLSSEAFAAETAAYSRASHDVAERLRRLENYSKASQSSFVSDAGFQQAVNALDQRLDYIQGDTFPNTLPTTAGDK